MTPTPISPANPTPPPSPPLPRVPAPPPPPQTAMTFALRYKTAEPPPPGLPPCGARLAEYGTPNLIVYSVSLRRVILKTYIPP